MIIYIQNSSIRTHWKLNRMMRWEPTALFNCSKLISFQPCQIKQCLQAQNQSINPSKWQFWRKCGEGEHMTIQSFCLREWENDINRSKMKLETWCFLHFNVMPIVLIRLVWLNSMFYQFLWTRLKTMISINCTSRFQWQS